MAYSRSGAREAAPSSCPSDQTPPLQRHHDLRDGEPDGEQGQQQRSKCRPPRNFLFEITNFNSDFGQGHPVDDSEAVTVLEAVSAEIEIGLAVVIDEDVAVDGRISLRGGLPQSDGSEPQGVQQRQAPRAIENHQAWTVDRATLDVLRGDADGTIRVSETMVRSEEGQGQRPRQGGVGLACRGRAGGALRALATVFPARSRSPSSASGATGGREPLKQRKSVFFGMGALPPNPRDLSHDANPGELAKSERGG